MIAVGRLFKHIAWEVLECLTKTEIMFSELEEKKEEKDKRKKEDYETLKKFREKQKLTKKQESIVNSKGFHKRIKKDKYVPKDKERDELQEKIALRNKEKKNEKLSKRLLENFYTIVLKLIRLHYTRPVFRIGLDCLMKFINRMPVLFVSQVINNLKAIFALLEAEENPLIDKKLKLIRTMLSLWKKVNFDGQLENHFLQKKLFSCFKILLTSEIAISDILIEDCFVNFDNLVMKPTISDSNVISNWFIILYHLACYDNRRVQLIAFYLMNKMIERNEKLIYFMEPSDTDCEKIPIPSDLMMLENKTISLKKPLTALISTFGADNKRKYLCQCIVDNVTLGKKYIGMDLKKFMNSCKN